MPTLMKLNPQSVRTDGDTLPRAALNQRVTIEVTPQRMT